MFHKLTVHTHRIHRLIVGRPRTDGRILTVHAAEIRLSDAEKAEIHKSHPILQDQRRTEEHLRAEHDAWLREVRRRVRAIYEPDRATVA